MQQKHNAKGNTTIMSDIPQVPAELSLGAVQVTVRFNELRDVRMSPVRGNTEIMGTLRIDKGSLFDGRIDGVSIPTNGNEQDTLSTYLTRLSILETNRTNLALLVQAAQQSQQKRTTPSES